MQLERYSALIQDYRDIKVLLPLAADCATRRDTLGQLHCLDYAFDVDPDFNAPDSVRRWLQACTGLFCGITCSSTLTLFADSRQLHCAHQGPRLVTTVR